MSSIKTPSTRISRRRYGLSVWGSTLLSGTVAIMAYSEFFKEGPRISVAEWLLVVPCFLAFSALLSTPLLAGFWLAVYAVGHSNRYRPRQQKALLCLALSLLYIPFFLVLMQLDPLPDGETALMLHSYLLWAFVFTWIYRLPTAP